MKFQIVLFVHNGYLRLHHCVQQLWISCVVLWMCLLCIFSIILCIFLSYLMSRDVLFFQLSYIFYRVYVTISIVNGFSPSSCWLYLYKGKESSWIIRWGFDMNDQLRVRKCVNLPCQNFFPIVPHSVSSL